MSWIFRASELDSYNTKGQFVCFISRSLVLSDVKMKHVSGPKILRKLPDLSRDLYPIPTLSII
jgi:hypothetical protein